MQKNRLKIFVGIALFLLVLTGASSELMANPCTGPCESGTEPNCVYDCDPNACEECVDDECESSCDPNGSCCQGSCCSPTQDCCGGDLCCDSNDVCCTDDGNYCCDPNEICCQGNCCDPDLCQDCNSVSGLCESFCDPNTEFCCEGTCCKNYECCIDGDCVDPVCYNCHSVSGTQYECGHESGDSNCASFWCIGNVFDTDTCSYIGDTWPCRKKNCDATPDGSNPGFVQTIYFLTSPCPTAGDPVEMVWWKTIYDGCDDNCSLTDWTKACAIGSCDTSTPLGDPTDRGQKYTCGCP